MTGDDPILAAIEAHRRAYAAYDLAADAPDDENEEAFRDLDRASQRLMAADASTMGGLVALLGYVAPLFSEAGAPGLPIEIPFAGRWSAAFGKFSANLANSLAAIVAAGSAVTPEHVDQGEAPPPPSGRELNPKDVLIDLFDSDDLSMPDPEATAEIVIQRLVDAGFEIK